MSRFFRSLVLLFVFIACAKAGFAQDRMADPQSPDEAALRQQYATFDRLLVEHDVDGVIALMAPDATFTAKGGKRRNLEQWKAAFNGQVKALTTTRTKVETITLKGNSADVKTWCEQRYDKLHLQGTDKTKFIIRSGAIDHWVKTSEGWRLKSSKQEAVDIEPID